MSDFSIEVDALCNVHCHLREGEVVEPLIYQAYRGGANVLAFMPNTTKGLTTSEEVLNYKKHLEWIAENYKIDIKFLPILMVNEQTSIDEIKRCVDVGIVDCKVYPLNRTTKSQNGVSRYAKILDLMRQAEETEMKYHFHPEHPWMLFDNRDAEFAFLPIIDMFLNETNATVIWEHGTDARCIPFWKEMAKSKRFFVTLTAHHLVATEDEEFGDVRSVCKPSIKTCRDRRELVELVKENYSWVMAGPDDAPHDRATKHLETGCCSCGAYTAPFLLQLYAHALNPSGGDSTFENFVSRNARKLHGLSQ